MQRKIGLRTLTANLLSLLYTYIIGVGTVGARGTIVLIDYIAPPSPNNFLATEV